jgi:hypothetical protein
MNLDLCSNIGPSSFFVSSFREIMESLQTIQKGLGKNRIMNDTHGTNTGTTEGQHNQRCMGKKVKITKDGQACRHCGTPVVKKEHTGEWQPKIGQSYYFEFWFICPNKGCRKMYLVEDAKVFLCKQAHCESGRHSIEQEAIECVGSQLRFTNPIYALENVNFSVTNWFR